MRPFKFRAKPVLALRQRQDDEAQRELANAVAARVAAEQAVEQATVAVDEAMLRSAKAKNTKHLPYLYDWHRNWIQSCQNGRRAAQELLDKRRQAERGVRGRAHETRRALRVIERWHERMWHAHADAARREEQRELDELGALRFSARRREEGGTGRGN